MIDPRELKYNYDQNISDELTVEIDDIYENTVDEVVERVKELIEEVAYDVVFSHNQDEQLREYVEKEVILMLKRAIKVTYD